MKKLAIFLLVFSFLCQSASGQRGGLVFHDIVFVDEWAESTLTEICIYNPNTAVLATIYKDQAQTQAITQPITTSSANTTLDGGRLTWWGPDGYSYRASTAWHTQNSFEAPPLNSSNTTIEMKTTIVQSTSLRNVRDYGAQGDGVTDDTAAIQAANNAAELVNGSVLFPPGTYKIGTGLTIDASVSWRGIGAIIKVKADIDIYGAYDATAKQWLTAECDRGDRDLTVTSSTGFVAGDTVIVVGYADHDDWSLDDVRYYCEWHDVNSAPAATTVRLDGQINGRMETGALTADHHPAVIEVDPISVNMYDLKFLLDGDDAQMDWRLCRDSGLHNCEITGTSSDGKRFLDVRACRNFTVENCSVHDITEDGYPVWIYTSDGVQIINNNVFMSPMGFLVQWSQNIVASGNVEKYLGSYGLYFAHCIGVSATGNTISHIPWDITGYEAAPQNCNAIMLVGVENGTFTGNSTYACHGEASGIYIRSGNYKYSGYTGKVEGDGLLKMPPTRNINVVGNTFIEPNELASAVAGHLGPIFGKSFGYNVNISNNTIICGTWTAAETVRAAIGLNGEFRNCSVTNNIIHTGNAKAIYFKDDATNAFFPGSIRIENNQIVLTDDYDVLSGGIISLANLEDDYDLGISSIRGNKITGSGQTTDEHMIYVTLQTADWTNYRLCIEDNWCKVDNSASAMRGLYVSVNATTVPSAGAVVFRNNYFDVDGVSYTTGGATAFAVEQVTTFTNDDTTPDTYGLSKMFKATNTNPTSITDFLQPATGQIIQVFATNGQTTIVDGSGIETFAGANFTLATDQVVSFVYDGTDWNQIGGAVGGASWTFTDENVAPTVAGQLKWDNIMTGWATGALAWYDGDEIRTLIDLDSSEALAAADDTKVVTYNWGGGNGYFNLSAAGSGDILSVWNTAAGAVTTPVIGTGEYLDGGTATTDAAGEGILLPRSNDVSAATAEGQISWDSDNDNLYVGTGAAVVLINAAASGDPVLIDTTAVADAAGVDFTSGNAIDITLNAGVSPDTATVAFDATEITGGTTWDDGGEASVTWTWNLSAGDPQITFGNAAISMLATTTHLGVDNTIGSMEVHDLGTIKFWDDGDDTSVVLGPVADGTTVLGVTGTINATGLQVGGAAVYYAGGTDVADADVADNITASSYLLLAGGTVSGTITDNDDLVLGLDENNDGTNKLSIINGLDGEVASITEAGVLYTASNIELGAAADTTISRSAAGAVQIEGLQVLLSGHALTGDVTATMDTDGSTVATIADTVTVTGWTLGASAATTAAASDNDTSLATTAWCETTQAYIQAADVPGLETNAAVDSEAEIEAITGAYFGASKVVTAGYLWVADGTDFESVPMSGDGSIASGGALTIANDSHTHVSANISDTHAGTVLTADLEEEVTEGSLADSTIVSADIKDATIAGGDLAAAIAITSTGAQDYSGASDFKVPVGANPTTNAAGEVAVDSSAAAGGGLRIYGDGTVAGYTLSAYQPKSFVILSPTAASDAPFWRVPFAITMRAIHVQVTGGTSVTGGLDEYNSAGAAIVAAVDADIVANAAASTDDDGGLTNPGIAAGNYLYWHTTSVDGTITSVTVSFEYTADQS
jgi:hypothetical protein